MQLPSAVSELLSRLRACGYEGYLVGGCTRDTLMGIPPHDYDITTSATPDEMKEVFSGYRLIETGVKHGTLTVRVGDENYELTTYRIDGTYSDSRHPDAVSFTRSLEEDLARRDFTMNAIAYSPETGYVDPFGGQADTKARLIRAVGEPTRRFEEDALRILRALRFSSVLGFAIEEKTAEAVFALQDRLTLVAPERVREELLKLLCGRGASSVLRRFASVFTVIIPELAPMMGCAQNTPYHLYDVWEHTLHVIDAVEPTALLRMTALLHDIEKPSSRTTDADGRDHFKGHEVRGAKTALSVLSRLRFDRRTRERIALLISLHDERPAPTEENALRLLSRIGEEAFDQLCLLRMADASAQSACSAETLDDVRRLREAADAALRAGIPYTVSALAVDGDDILAVGLKGKAVGRMLSELLDAVISRKVENTKPALLAYIKAHASNDPE